MKCQTRKTIDSDLIVWRTLISYFTFYYSLHCLVLPSFRWKRKREYHYEVGHMIVTKKTIININNMWIIAMSLWWRMISLLLSPYQLYFRYFYCQLIFSDLRKKQATTVFKLVCVCFYINNIFVHERDSDIYGGKNVMKYAVTRKYYAAAWHVHAVMWTSTGIDRL